MGSELGRRLGLPSDGLGTLLCGMGLALHYPIHFPIPRFRIAAILQFIYTCKYDA